MRINKYCIESELKYSAKETVLGVEAAVFATELCPVVANNGGLVR